MQKPKIETIDIVFDGPPGPEGPRFVEVEDSKGKSLSRNWVKRADGYWVIRLSEVVSSEGDG